MYIRKDGYVNIPSTIEDDNYRYFMPLIKQRVIGRGINIRTEFLNLKEIAKALFIDVEYILKYFGQEFGSKTTLKKDPKTSEISLISINGAISLEDITKKLDQFINSYILCDKDKTPEVVIKVDGNEVYGQCDSCGSIKKLDQNHRMTIYMKKNPPKNYHIEEKDERVEEK